MIEVNNMVLLTVTLLSVSVFVMQDYSAAINEFVLPRSQCTCPGHVLTYECTVTGSGSTVWKGSAFECISGEIVLQHNLFDQMTAAGICNGGLFIAYGVRVANNSYTSQLNITASHNNVGKTIQCAYDDGQREVIIGTDTVSITNEPYQPPNRIIPALINENILLFTWNETTSNCLALQYNIIASRCGICPSITSHPVATCNDVEAIGQECRFTVQTVVCGNIIGNQSYPVVLTLAVPQAPEINVIPYYYLDSRKLKNISVEFNETRSFDISTGIDGSPTSYTISFSSTSGTICSAATLPAALCRERVCSYTFEVEPSACFSSAKISVSVVATNVLGSGQPSTSLIIESVNVYLSVFIDTSSAYVACKFINQSRSGIKSCVVTYGSGKSCHNLTFKSYSTYYAYSTVFVEIASTPFNMKEERHFCFIVTASNDSFMVKIEGLIITGCDPTELGNTNIIQDDKMLCDAPYKSLAFSNGIACYDQTGVGYSAVYYCLNCGLNTFQKILSVRTCLSNGSWNGTIPHCDCDEYETIFQNPVVILIISMMIILTILVPTLLSIIIFQAKTKARIRSQLKEAQKHTRIYEEIDKPYASINITAPQLPPLLDYARNIAYVHMSGAGHKDQVQLESQNESKQPTPLNQVDNQSCKVTDNIN